MISDQPIAPVAWRDGIHVVNTPIWCDARRTRDLCFVSAASAVASPRHGQYLATDITLSLLGRRARPTDPGSHLAVPYGHPFTLGSLRLELFRSGHAAGSASLLVCKGEQRIVYAGAVNPAGGGLVARPTSAAATSWS